MMLKCIFIRRRLYDYLDNSLSEKEKARVKSHLAACLSCRRSFEQAGVLLDLARQKKMPQQNEDFWHNFRTELDQKLNARLVPPFNFKPNLGYRLKPVLALVSVIILVMGVSTYIYRKPPHLIIAQSDSTLVDELSLLEELDTEAYFNHNEDAYMDELELLYDLDIDPA